MIARSLLRSEPGTLVVVFAAAFAARMVWQVAVDFYDHPEVWEPDEIARNILAGRG